MINLKPIILTIESLLKEDTAQSVTYAALEARLAIEKICYDRLRFRHDYISHADLKRWQPAAIVNQLMAEVDSNVAETYSLSISNGPLDKEVDPEKQEYLHVGTAVGFDPKKVSKLWNSLSGLALHVRLPESKDDFIPAYGNKDKTKAKVEEALVELCRLSEATLELSGIGKEVSFECNCGTLNKRRAELLKSGSEIRCINPSCEFTWLVLKNEDNNNIVFKCNFVELICDSCSDEILLARRPLTEMKFGQQLSATCASCGKKNFLRMALQHGHLIG